MLAFVNESASSLRGDNRRVTGFVPLWLIALWRRAGGHRVGACRGVVQIYLRDVAALDASAMPALLLPLTIVWLICLLAVICWDRDLRAGILVEAVHGFG